MTTLFLDTTYNQILGFLDDRGAWIDYKMSIGQKSSAQLHLELQEIVKNSNIIKADIKKVFYIAGPGFYTGLRIAFGIADMLRIEDRNLTSFYSYEIPKMLGVTNYRWLTKAYRGEVFIYEFCDGNESSRLVSEKDFLAQDWSGHSYIHHESALDDLMKSKITDFTETQKLLIADIEKIFRYQSSRNDLKPLYYFRPPEDEFKPSV